MRNRPFHYPSQARLFGAPQFAPGAFAVLGGSTLALGLTSFWKLDEASGTRADVTGANPLTDNNTVTQAAGKLGNAASFAAANSEYLRVVHNSSQNWSTGFGLSIWLWPTNFSANRAWLVKDSAGQRKFHFEARTTAKPQFTLAHDLAGSAYGVVTPGGTLTASAWNHVVFSYDGSLADVDRAKVWLNGAAQTLTLTGTVPAAMPLSTTALHMGSTNTPHEFWDGRIDASGIWNRPLTASEVATLYNSGDGLELGT
jgi:hypothetical protein